MSKPKRKEHNDKSQDAGEEAKSQAHVSGKGRKNVAKKSMKPNFWAIIAIAEFAIIIFLLFYSPGGWQPKEREQPLPAAEKQASIEVFLMSYCGYGNTAEEMLYEVHKQVGDAVEIIPRYIYYGSLSEDRMGPDYCIEDNEKETYCSMFGIQDLNQGIREECVYLDFGPDEWFRFALEMNTRCNARNADTCWEPVAQDLGLDVAAIKRCQAERGLEIVKDNFEVTQRLGVTGSPTIFINNERYTGQRTADSMVRSLCSEFELSHDACDNITEEPEVRMIALNDERCGADCDITVLIAQLKQVFPKNSISYVDYMTDEGKELYEKTGAEFLPAVFFEDSIFDSEGISDVGPFLVEAGDYYMLLIGADFDPRKEICDNGIDDTGNGLIDCEDPDCADTLVCNPDLFSECAAEQGLAPETVIFYYSDGCPWCTLMKPGVEQLKEEGYLIESVNAGIAEEAAIVECFRDYMGTGVPQFICPKTADIRPGAFADMSQNLDMDALRAWVDACIAG
ncbi:MAG TPA: hypothetical protein ENN46_04775 [Candidatus Woesearchaeota archaeon]|nr:hypothetical protein [Candidatus Woesearchaeota archaeon]